VIPVVLGLAGASLLFTASLRLIAESRIAVASITDEMDFVVRLGQVHAPENMPERSPRRWRFRKNDRRSGATRSVTE
jgi:hypothetical protein